MVSRKNNQYEAMDGNFSKQEIIIFKKLNTPSKIQDYLNSLRFNFEENGQTCYSPRMVLRKKSSHCMEGAMFAAAALEFLGFEPLLVDLRAAKHDFDHVIAVFKQYGGWGSISKTNHGVLRYREPIYRDIRELAVSFFHEYFDGKGRKNLREYSNPVNLLKFNKLDWRTSEEDLWDIPYALENTKHFKIITDEQIKNLRKADGIEIKTGKIVEWIKKK